MICHNCRQRLSFPAQERIPFKETCPHCQSYLHCCLNCRRHDPGRSNQCSEPQAEWVGDRAQGNYCEYFAPAPESKGHDQEKSDKEKARKKLDELFK